MESSQVAMQRWVVVTAVALLTLGCGGEEEPQEELTRHLSVEVSHSVVVPTSQVKVQLGGTTRMEADEATVTLQGSVGDREVEQSFDVDVYRDGDVGELYFELDAGDRLWPLIEPGDRSVFDGTLAVEMVDVLGVFATGELERLRWRFRSDLKPSLHLEISRSLFPDTVVELEGDGVLRPDEGETVAVIEEGIFEADRGHSLELSGRALPVRWVGDRQRGALHFDPAVVGVHPGELRADLRFENRFDDGTVSSSPRGEQRLEAEMETTFIASVSPDAASRGQIVDIAGRGFVDRQPGDQHGMLLQFEGTVTPSDPQMQPVSFDGTGDDEIIPYRIDDDETIAQEVWYDVVNRQLEGLGAVVGTFQGTITPVVYDEFGQMEGVAWQGELDILPPRQVVYLKYLPSFSVALGRFGLLNVEWEIREQILEVVQRDFADFNVEVVDRPPEDFASFATVEIGGPDPTGGMTFGVDNTYEGQPKDTGNLHLDSYLGGINREGGEQLGTPYGGVFVESFAIFSPTLYPEMGNTSGRFDDIFGPFMSDLGGDEVLATEWPDGERADKIEEAIRVFANVVGNTASHEVGHSMGLTHFEDDWEDSEVNIFHNPAGDGYIMDAGMDRSFEQRAVIDGEERMGFNERNRAYLSEILPTE